MIEFDGFQIHKKPGQNQKWFVSSFSGSGVFARVPVLHCKVFSFKLSEVVKHTSVKMVFHCPGRVPIVITVATQLKQGSIKVEKGFQLYMLVNCIP